MYFVEPQPARPAPAFVVAPAPASPASASAAAISTTGGVAVAEPQVATAVRADPAVVSVAETPRIVYPGAWLALAIALIATIALGILPGAMVDLAAQAAQSLLR
jgi:hypothetical protein